MGEADSAMRVRLLTRVAGGPHLDEELPARGKARLSEEALAMARRLGDDSAHAGLRHARLHPRPPLADHVRSQLELATELIAVAGRAGDKERVFDGHEERFDALLELGYVQAARAELDAMTGWRASADNPSQPWLVRRARGDPRADGRPVRRRRGVGGGGARPGRARAGLERDGHPSPAALRAPPRTGPAGRGRGPHPPIGRRAPDLPDHSLRAGPRARGGGRARRGARHARGAHPRPLRRAALRRGVAREHVPAGRCPATVLGASGEPQRLLYELRRCTTTTSRSATRR